MKEINKEACRTLRERINAALASLAAELDINITAAGARFTPTNATFKLEIAVKGENGKVVSKFAETYNQLCLVYGLPKDGLGKTINFNGQQFVVTGLNPQCSRYPIMADCKQNGRGYKLPLSALGGKA